MNLIWLQVGWLEQVGISFRERSDNKGKLDSENQDMYDAIQKKIS